MTKGKVEEAERLALNNFDRWNNATGFVTKHTSYYYELQGVIEDAVHIGIQITLNGEINYDQDGNIKHKD